MLESTFVCLAVPSAEIHLAACVLSLGTGALLESTFVCQACPAVEISLVHSGSGIWDTSLDATPVCSASLGCGKMRCLSKFEDGVWRACLVPTFVCSVPTKVRQGVAL